MRSILHRLGLRPTRRRPASGVRVIDMDAAITTLDPITSSFTTMLMEAYHRPYVYRPPSSEWGDFDWIDTPVDAREALLAFERKAAEREAPTVAWLEDELFPRLSA